MNSKVGLLFGHFFKGSLKKQTTLLRVLLWTLCKYSFVIQAHRITAARQITTMWILDCEKMSVEVNFHTHS